uniref:50S ribosomal protein L9, chloroplastic n=1 Tax=Ceramothamnion japonicum TaxID=218448 RepID=A0A1C9CDJ3_CERJP|nr:ribosomal protein L9 [Ceramium japonicum]AOM66432.1 ribosomal protein L9 [Ceramium japonicum]
MTKNITVIVKKAYPKLGNKGEIIKLSKGYAFNYLIPKNIVEIPTKGKIKHLQMFQNIANNKKQSLIIDAKHKRNIIKNIDAIHITKKIGNMPYIFGSVNEKEILNTILKQTKQKIEKKDIKIPEIKSIGLFNLTIKFIDNETCNLLLQVVPNNI